MGEVKIEREGEGCKRMGEEEIEKEGKGNWEEA